MNVQGCPGFPAFDGDSFEPRCRLWYQDATQAGNEGVIFTNPYVDADTKALIVTAAAPVLDPAGGAILGVVGLDVDFGDIEISINDLTVTDDQGYAYLLAPGGEGQVAVHGELKQLNGQQYIVDLEEGFEASEEEKEAFEVLVTTMSGVCAGAEEYEKGGATWILAWAHETVSGFSASGSDGCGEDGGFIVVVTVSEAALLEVSEA